MITWSPWAAGASELLAGRGTHADVRALRRFTAPARGAWFWLALWAAGAAAGFAALIPVIFDRGPPLPGPEVVFRLVGLSFCGCGLVAWRRRPDSDVGRLLTAAGFGVFVFPLLSQLESDLAFTGAVLFGSVWTIAFAALVLTFVTGGRLESAVDRVVVGAFFVALFVLQFLSLLFTEQPDNVLLLSPNAGLAEALDTSQRVLAIAASLAIVAVTAARWRLASQPRRRALLPSVAGSVCAVLFAAMLVSDLVADSHPLAVDWLANTALLLVPAAFLAGLLRSRLARAGLAELFRELAGRRGARLELALANCLGDPRLVLAYRRPEGAHYVDADDRDVTLPRAGGTRAVTPIERDGRPLGALVYDASLDDDPELVQAVAAAAAIALDDERLRVEAEARLGELRASRERIVTAGDDARRQLERNLHDGAQQRLVAVSLQLRMIQSRIRENPALAEQLVTAAGDELSQSLEELRELARGLHPAVLNHGLHAALDSLAGRSPVPTAVSCIDGGAFPQPVQLAAYFVACEALANVAKYAHATRASVRVSRRDGVAVIEVTDDGVGGADESAGTGLLGLADRVAALDGTLRILSPPGAGTVVTAELPCAS